MSKTSRGDVWLADLGMAAKVRPVAVPDAKFLRKIGTLEPAQLEQLEKAVKRWLGLS